LRQPVSQANVTIGWISSESSRRTAVKASSSKNPLRGLLFLRTGMNSAAATLGGIAALPAADHHFPRESAGRNLGRKRINRMSRRLLFEVGYGPVSAIHSGRHL
jgi:hypothetical protein